MPQEHGVIIDFLMDLWRIGGQSWWSWWRFLAYLNYWNKFYFVKVVIKCHFMPQEHGVIIGFLMDLWRIGGQSWWSWPCRSNIWCIRKWLLVLDPLISCLNVSGTQASRRGSWWILGGRVGAVWQFLHVVNCYKSLSSKCQTNVPLWHFR